VTVVTKEKIDSVQRITTPVALVFIAGVFAYRQFVPTTDPIHNDALTLAKLGWQLDRVNTQLDKLGIDTAAANAELLAKIGDTQTRLARVEEAVSMIHSINASQAEEIRSLQRKP